MHHPLCGAICLVFGCVSWSTDPDFWLKLGMGIGMHWYLAEIVTDAVQNRVYLMAVPKVCWIGYRRLGRFSLLRRLLFL